MNRNLKTILFSVGVSALLAFPAAQAANVRPQADKEEAQVDRQENDVRKVLIDLASAVNGGDAEKAASFFSQNVVFIDEAGEETHGLPALKERLGNAFRQRNSSDMRLHPERINFPAPSVALVVGSVSRKSGLLELPATRFSMALVKSGDSWSINEATETAIQESKAADHLKELGWLIGNWQVDRPGATAKLEVQWEGNRNFIRSKCISIRDGAQQIDSQVIGWDPRSKSIVSWHFDNNGGFGYGQWRKDSDHWLVDFAGVGTRGSSTRATNVFTVTKPDQFTWQSTDQSADGMAIADTEPITVKRITQ